MEMTRRSVLLSSVMAPMAMAQKKNVWLYVGSYTNARAKGITVMKFDVTTGAMSDMEVAAETPNPTFLALHPSGKFLYAANETGNYKGEKAGAVSAYSIDRATGKLTLLNEVSSKGQGPCHISVDKSGRMAMIANYVGGSVASYQILEDGRLSEAVSFFQHKGSGPMKGRQDGPHGHSITPAPDGRHAVACDLGTDELHVYKIDPGKGKMETGKVFNMAPGAGPRHFVFHPKGRMGYAVNELNSTVTALAYDGAGGLEEIQTISTLTPEFKGTNWPAEIRVHPSGKWVYASNRGDDSIAVFEVDKQTDKLKWLDRTPTQGKNPRNFHIDASGRWLMAANQNTNNIIVFEVDVKTGKLITTGKGMTVGSPVCLRTL